VGYPLAEMLIQDGATVIACDPNKFAVERAVKDLGIKIVGLDEIYSQDVDIFSPCALGATVNETTISQLKATIIAGSANNQLFNDACGILLQKKKILYAPDYVINAGGVLWTAQELVETTPDATMKKIENIYDRLMQIFERSQKTGELTKIIADKMAWEKIHQHDHRVVA
jgi:leucine dehydrogenase